jgi:hypothetical protein
MANKDLFKQAIAEAKSVREAAIANAKEALEETLTPHLKDMLAAKLQEMDDSSVEEEVVNEVEEEVEEGMDKDKKDEAIEEDLSVEAEEMDAEEADDDSEESDEEAEEDIEVKDMEVDDLKDLIRDIIAQEMGAEAEGEEMPADELPTDDMVGAEDEEEIDLDELLKEIAEMDSEHKDEAMSHDDDHKDEAMDPKKKDEAMDHDKKDEAMHSDDHKDESMINEVDPLTVGAGVAAIFGASVGLDKLMSKLEAGDFGPQGEKLAAGLRKHGKAAANRYNEGEVEVSNETEMEEVSMHTRTPENNDLLKAMDFIGKQAKKAGKSVADFVKGIELGKMSDAMREIEVEEASELEEAMTTINEMKGKLQEVNLLNAKLLYVNKVFKANNLTESQKVNVIAAFDKAETVKEVKLVFETVADNVVSKSTKSTIRESKLGMASKATGTTASKPEVIAEVSDAVLRMQKLAGIIK